MITLDDSFMCDFYKNEKDMLLTVKSNLMLRFIGVTLNHHLIKSGNALIHASFHESKCQYFGFFHECKHQDFVSLRESNNQEFGHLDGAILWKIKLYV